MRGILGGGGGGVVAGRPDCRKPVEVSTRFGLAVRR